MQLYIQFYKIMAYSVIIQICDWLNVLLFVYCYFLITYFQITETPPDVVEVVKTDQNAFEDYIQARAEKVFDQVHIFVCC